MTVAPGVLMRSIETNRCARSPRAHRPSISRWRLRSPLSHQRVDSEPCRKILDVRFCSLTSGASSYVTLVESDCRAMIAPDKG